MYYKFNEQQYNETNIQNDLEKFNFKIFRKGYKILLELRWLFREFMIISHYIKKYLWIDDFVIEKIFLTLIMEFLPKTM